MDIEALLPRPLDPQSGLECPTILGAMLTASHFERAKARALGWRGILPSVSETPGWTCKIAGSPHVFGLVFAGESVIGDKYIEGTFHSYVFPQPEDALLERFSLAALHQAMEEDYSARIRRIGVHEDTLQDFLLGLLRLKISLDKQALTLSLTAPDHHRTIAVDGVAAEDGRWVIAPGGYDCDIPAFRLLVRFFSTLAGTMEKQAGEQARYWLNTSPIPVQGVDTAGNFSPCPGWHVRLIQLTATLGAAAEPPEARRLSHLPLRYRPAVSADASRPVLHVLTGFLGAGKTTFLRHWLDFLHGRERYTGVIQNEFGAVNVDAALLRGSTGVEALEDGCVCCSLADSLRPGLERLISSMPAQQIILETTGLANPESLLATLQSLEDLVVPGLVITVLDTCRMEENGFSGEEIHRAQIEKADVLILSKTDLHPEQDVHGLALRAAELNPRALVLCADNGHIAFAELDAWLESHGGYTQCGPIPPLPHAHGKSGITAHTVRLPPETSRQDIEAVISAAGPGLIRAKGMVRLREKGMCMIQYASGTLNFENVPESTPPSGLILIGSGLLFPGRTESLRPGR